MRRNRFLWAPEIRERSKIDVKYYEAVKIFKFSRGREWCGSLRWSEKNYKKIENALYDVYCSFFR